MNEFSLNGYRKLLRTFQSKDYKFLKFQNVLRLVIKYPFILLRHDIDFSLHGALEMARVEKKEGVLSTFFLFLRSPFYNVLSSRNCEIIHEINSFGHDVALHIDLNFYKEGYISGLKNEIDILQTFFPFANIEIVSLHRPGGLVKARSIELSKTNHTYERTFTDDIEYISDSDSIWKYGYPTNSHAFRKNKPIQLLTHPLWWTQNGNRPLEKIQKYIDFNRGLLIESFRDSLVFDIEL